MPVQFCQLRKSWIVNNKHCTPLPPFLLPPFIQLNRYSWDVLTLVHSTQLNAKKTKTQPRNPKNSNPGPRAQGPSTSPSHRNKNVSPQQVSSNSFPAV